METNTIQTPAEPVTAMVVGSGPWLGSDDGRVVLHNCACEDVPMPEAAAAITDPPYEIGKAWKRGFHGTNGKSPLWHVG